MEIKFTKVRAGHYATADGRYAVIADGYDRISETDREGAGVAAGITGREWATVFCANGDGRVDPQAGETIDWFDTKREAVDRARFEARGRREVATPEQEATVARIGRYYRVHRATPVGDVVEVVAAGIPDGIEARWTIARNGNPSRVA